MKTQTFTHRSLGQVEVTAIELNTFNPKMDLLTIDNGKRYFAYAFTDYSITILNITASND